VTEPTRSHAPGPRLVELQVADEPGAWVDAGFAVEDDVVTLGSVRLRLLGADPDVHGIVGWSLAGVEVTDGDLDGLPTTVAASGSDGGAPGGEPHPNGTIGLDHVVVATPDLERTLDALAGAGLDLRRIRETTSHGSPMRQAFYRLGPTVLEVVSGDTGSGLPAADAPARWFGLAIDVDDLDQTAALLDDGLGPIKAAVQPGRRIATLRHRTFGVSVAVAAMDDHADR
jgi:catechol 2,3-dioxygenase-like lactoylglutathione lyase family enzyme